MRRQTNPEFEQLIKTLLKDNLPEIAATMHVPINTLENMKRGIIPPKENILKLAKALNLPFDDTNRLLSAAKYDPLLGEFQSKVDHLKRKYEGLKYHYERQIELLTQLKELPPELLERGKSQYQELIEKGGKRLELIRNIEASHSSGIDRPVLSLSTNLEDDLVYRHTPNQDIKERIEKRQLSKEEYLTCICDDIYKKVSEEELKEMLKELFYSPRYGYPSNESVESLLAFLAPDLKQVETEEDVRKKQIEPLLKQGLSYRQIGKQTSLPHTIIRRIAMKYFPDEASTGSEFFKNTTQKAVEIGLSKLREKGTFSFEDLTEREPYLPNRVLLFGYWAKWVRKNPRFDGYEIVENRTPKGKLVYSARSAEDFFTQTALVG